MDFLWIGPEDQTTLTSGEHWRGFQKLGSVPWHEWEPMETCVGPGQVRTPAEMRQGQTSQAGRRRGHVIAGRVGQCMWRGEGWQERWYRSDRLQLSGQGEERGVLGQEERNSREPLPDPGELAA